MAYSIERNFHDSPLLKLPPEIRDKVWRYVLGDRLVHLRYERLWKHHVCQNDGLESRDFEERTSESESYFVGPHESCQHHCKPRDRKAKAVCSDIERLSLTVLRSCRQAYVESSHILGTTNTFDFVEISTFKQFLKMASVDQKPLIQRLRLTLGNGSENPDMYSDFWAWDRVLTMSTVKSLSRLRSLRVQILYTIDLSEFKYWSQRCSRLYQLYPSTYSKGLHRLSTLTLTEVEVAVKVLYEAGFMWKEDERRKYADGLRKLLLDPKGAEIFAQNEQ